MRIKYIDLLRLYKLEPLEHRRIKNDLITFHKILYGIPSLAHNNSFTIRESRIRGDRFKISTHNCAKTSRHNSFLIRAPRLYNLLVSEIKANPPILFAKLLGGIQLTSIPAFKDKTSFDIS